MKTLVRHRFALTHSRTFMATFMLKSMATLAASATLSCGPRVAAKAPLASVAPSAVPPAPAPTVDAKAAEAVAALPLDHPPPSSTSRAFRFPQVDRTRLPTGLELATVEAHALPIVQVRLMVRAGMGYGGQPGVAQFTAQMLKDGGTRTMTSARLLERIETMGADLGVTVGTDSTVLSLGVTRDKVVEAIRILAEVTSAPRFDESEFKKLRERELDAAREKAKASGAFMATRVLFRELFASANPYASFEIAPSDIPAITLDKVKDFHRRFYVSRNTTLIIAGDIDPTFAKRVASEAFATYRAGDAPRIDFPAAILPAKSRVVVADRPKSAQSEIYVTMLAPERTTTEWPALRVATQVLGGGPASRLFLDVREQRSLAYATRASIVELAHGPEPLVAYAGTQTPKTVATIQGIVDNLVRLTKEAPTQDETEAARRNLSDIFAVRMETIGAIADLIAQGTTLGLPDTYWDDYRASVLTIDAAKAAQSARKWLSADRALIVVAGDAATIAPSLTVFGEVTVVDPEQNFSTVRTLSAAKNPG